ncbi:MAG: histone deacetylase [Planctomycetes bacterium]|nr:histone deacetylase [Planctomycetota bacterium]
MLLLIQDACFDRHITPAGHPERPARTAAIRAALSAAALPDRRVRAEVPRAATPEELMRVHAPEYVARLREFCAAGGGMLDADTHAVPESFEVASRASGAAVQAAEYLLSGAGRTAFCAVRPPGHHAGRAYAMGFCLFNHAAVAAAHLRARDPEARVLIVDWDLHHGNGTQDIFFADPNVFYFSMHRFPFWPGTGSATETGTGAGVGATLNVPLEAGASRDRIREAFAAGLKTIADRFQPTWLVISSGFDMHRTDPLGGLSLESEDYATMTWALGEQYMNRGARGVVSVLEGGYALEGLAQSVVAHVKALMDLDLK